MRRDQDEIRGPRKAVGKLWGKGEVKGHLLVVTDPPGVFRRMQEGAMGEPRRVLGSALGSLG